MSARQRVAPADRGDDDVGLARVLRRDRACALWQMVTVALACKQQQRHRLADDVAAADHDRVLAAQVDAGASRSASCSRTACTAGSRAGRSSARRRSATEKPSTSLRGDDRLDHLVRVDVLAAAASAPGCRGSPGRRSARRCAPAARPRPASAAYFSSTECMPAVVAGLDLVAHVDLARPGRRRPGSPPGRADGRARSSAAARSRDLGADLLGEGGAVDQLCGHGAILESKRPLRSGLRAGGALRPWPARRARSSADRPRCWRSAFP